MTERSSEEISPLLQERQNELQQIKKEELSDDEPDYEEAFDEVDDIQDGDKDTSLDNRQENRVHLEHDSEEEQAPDRLGHHCSVILGENNYKWYTNAPEADGQQSLKVYLPKANDNAKNIKTPMEAWSLLFPTDLLEIVVWHTNEEIRRRVTGANGTHCQETNLVELKALIGLLYFSGLEKQNKTCTEDLWMPRFGNNLYRSVMQKHRFHYLLECLRFDDKATRFKRQETHGLAPIKEIWDLFISNCTQYYCPSTFCTIDEQLLNFRGRFRSKVYMPNEPDKLGIKIVSMNDAETSYLISAEPYVGRVQTFEGESVPSYYVQKLSESIHYTERNITCDNWFTSIDLVEKMKINYGLTMVGTIRKNKREIPPSFTRPAAAGTTRFAYANGNTLVSYCPKRNKVVLLLSSLHKSGRIDNDAEQPEIIAFYNRTKGGTATFEQMCHAYTTARVTSRWPLRMFFGMLDQAGINSIILYNLQPSNAAMSRRNFIKELTFALIQPHLHSRLQLPTLRTSLRVIIQEILEVKPQTPTKTHKLQKRKRCAFCTNDKKTIYCCARCEKPTCDDHRISFCAGCSEAS